MKDGREYIHRENIGKGDPKKPMKLQDKCMSSASMIVGREKAISIASKVSKPEKIQDVTELSELLFP